MFVMHMCAYIMAQMYDRVYRTTHCTCTSVRNSRIRFILELLFPRGQKGIVPKDNMPINLYVKLIQFISRVSQAIQLHRKVNISRK